MTKTVHIPIRPRDAEPEPERDARTVDWLNDSQPLAPHPSHPLHAEFLGTNADPDPLPTVSDALAAVEIGKSLTASQDGTSNLTAMMRKRQLIVELQSLDELETRAQYESGKRFAELQEICEHGEFLKILSGHLNGKSQRSAYQYIQFYKMCEQVPALALEKNFTKAITLRNALKDEGLTIDALNGVDFKEITAEAIDSMSASQLKKEIKRLTREVGDVVKEETKALVQERDQLIKERDEAIAKNDPPNWKATKERALELAKIAEKLGTQTAVMIDMMPGGEVPTDMVFGIEAALFRAQTAAQTAWERFTRLKESEEQIGRMEGDQI